MRRIYSFFIIISLFLFSCNYKNENLPKTQSLQWEYSDSLNAKIWEPALTPSSIYTALSDNLFLAKNFYFDHYTQKIKWLSKKSWFYKTTINIDEQTLKNKQFWILFPGLDTYTKIYINGQTIAQTNDFFKHYTFDIKKYLHPGKNEIIIQFYPPIKKTQQLFSTLKDRQQLPVLSILRKPYFHLNNSLGATYIPIGFSQQTQILIWEKAFIHNIHYSFSNITKNSALVKANITIYASKSKTARLQIKSQYTIHLDKKIKLRPGKNNFTFSFKISNPHLWYPYSKEHTQPELYKFTTTLFIKKTKYSEISFYTGIRKLNIYTSGKKLYIKINDSTLLLRAAQIYPLRIELLNEQNLYERFIKLIKNAGFNAVITSDKGWYYNDQFYTLCDQEGIMVIQTLPLAYKRLPADDTITNLILDETKQNILRLSQHPSIIAWNTNFNPQKIHFASKQQKTFSTNLFTQILPTIILSEDSSACVLTNFNFRNVINIQQQSISLPNTKLVFNFFAMQDTQRLLDQTLSFFTKPDTLLYYKLKRQASRIYPPDSLKNFYYFSQLIQKQVFEQYIKQLKPNYQNHIIVHWFNDITPALSPSFIDYSLIPKAKYYTLKQFLSDFQIFTKNSGKNVEVTIVSSADTASVLAYYKLYDFYGHLLWQKVENTKIINHTVDQVFDLGIYYKLFSRDSILMKIELYNSLELVAEKYHYFINPNRIQLKDPQLKILYYPVDEGFAIEIIAQKYLAKDVHITTETQSIIDNNFFDILPGESKIVVIATQFQAENFAPFINVYSKYDYLTGIVNRPNHKFNIQPKEFQQINE